MKQKRKKIQKKQTEKKTHDDRISNPGLCFENNCGYHYTINGYTLCEVLNDIFIPISNYRGGIKFFFDKKLNVIYKKNNGIVFLKPAIFFEEFL